ncbi:MAG: ATP12 family protein [Pseudomonadota bacterium]
MSEWAMKRFWKEVSFEKHNSSFHVVLDGRSVKTPAKRLLVLPTEAMAFQIAREWDAQDGVIDPRQMPWTRSANAALDKVASQRSEVCGHLTGYAGTDLLCYRADSPQGLVERQTELWDPILDWVAEKFGSRLKVTSGVMPVAQDSSDVERLAAIMRGFSVFQLTGFYDLVTLSGSFVLALAATEGIRTPEELWSLSRVDEDWQIEQWGADEEAADHAELKKSAFFHASDFFKAA